jgi:hypothetical protein
MVPKLRTVLDVLALIVTVLAFPVIAYQLWDVERIARSQNNILLSTMFFHDPTNLGIINAIENKKPILKTPGGEGQFTSTQLDGYLGDLETVYDVYDEGLLSEAELCGSFSVYVQAEADSEVQDYLKENSHYFSGLPKLFDIVDHSKNENCRD